MLAQCMKSTNSITGLRERTGVNVHEVSRAIGIDTPVGRKLLKATIDYGGSCSQEDMLNLVYLGEQFGLSEVAHC